MKVMKWPMFWTVSGSIVVFAAAWIAILEHQEAEQLRQELAAAALRPPARPASPIAEDAPLKEKLRSAAKENRRLEAALSEQTRVSKSGKDTTVDSPLNETVATIANRWLALTEDQELVQQLNAQQLAQINRRYAPLFAGLGLTPEQTAKLSQLIAEKRQSAVEVALAMIKSGKDPAADSSEYQTTLNGVKLNLENEIKKALGEDGYATYQNYDRSMGREGTVTNLRQSLSLSATPLRDEQVRQLNALLESHKIGHLNEDIIQGARNFLEPAQLDALQSLWQEQQTNRDRRVIQQKVFSPAILPPGAKN